MRINKSQSQYRSRAMTQPYELTGETWTDHTFLPVSIYRLSTKPPRHSVIPHPHPSLSLSPFLLPTHQTPSYSLQPTAYKIYHSHLSLCVSLLTISLTHSLSLSITSPQIHTHNSINPQIYKLTNSLTDSHTPSTYVLKPTPVPFRKKEERKEKVGAWKYDIC